jgi:plastocyanin
VTVRAAFVALALSAPLGLSGCGGHSGGAHTGDARSCANVLPTLSPVTRKGERAATGATLDIDAANAAFDPTCVTDVPRGTFALTVHNTGLVIHDVSIPDQHVDVDIRPGHSVTIRIQVGAQPVVYGCRYHRALGMVGVLIPSATS